MTKKYIDDNEFRLFNKNCQISTKLLTSNLSIMYTINMIDYMNKKIDIGTCMECLEIFIWLLI